MGDSYTQTLLRGTPPLPAPSPAPIRRSARRASTPAAPAAGPIASTSTAQLPLPRTRSRKTSPNNSTGSSASSTGAEAGVGKRGRKRERGVDQDAVWPQEPEGVVQHKLESRKGKGRAVSQQVTVSAPTILTPRTVSAPVTSHAHSLSSVTPLPSLLSHLSLSPSFPASPSPVSAQGTFSFPIPTFSSRHPYPHLHPLQSSHHPYYRAYVRPFHEMDLTDKRPMDDPHPHLYARTKKQKLVHRFFRCEAILSGPTPPTSTSGSPVSSPPVSPPTRNQRPLPSLLLSSSPTPTPTYTPQPTRRPPAWWPSVSRSSGDGLASRMGPAEAQWVGDGSGWYSKLQLRLGRAVLGQESSFVIRQNNKGKGPQVLDERMAIDGHGGASTSGGAAMSTAAGSAPMTRTRTRGSRSLSSPPAFQMQAQSNSGGGPWAPPPLKQHLLAVLRMRLSEGGGSSKGGEAGLKFKKWVVWNSWMKRSQSTLSDDDDLLDAGSDSEDDFDGDMDLLLPHDDDSYGSQLDEGFAEGGTNGDPQELALSPTDWQGSSIFQGDDGRPESSSTPTSSTEPAYTAQSSDPSSSSMTDDSDPLASSSPPSSSTPSTSSSLPQSPRKSPRALPDLQLQESLSYALGVSPGSTGTTRGAKLVSSVLSIAPLPAASSTVSVVSSSTSSSSSVLQNHRPPIRRAHSVPSTAVSEMSLRDDYGVEEERDRPKSPIACEG